MRRLARWADGLVLAAVALVSTLPYVGRLGFYSDDWAFLASLELNDDRSFGGLYRVLAEVHFLDKRPVQAVTQVVLYGLFGTAPFGYHLFSALLLAATTVAFWLVLRELGLPRLVAVAVPAVFAVLPMASTAWFWFAAFGYALTLLFFLISAFADLRAIREPGRIAWPWKVLAWLALVACGLAYEVAVPLLGGLVLVLAVLSRRRSISLLPLAGNVVLLAGLVVFKAVTFGDETTSTSVLSNARNVARATVYEYGTFGIGLPQAAWWGFGEVGGVALAVTLAVAVMVGWWLRRIAMRDGVPPAQLWFSVAAAGLGVTALALTVFVVDYRIGVTTTGAGNRTWAAASLGMAMTLAGAAGGVAALLPRPERVAPPFLAGAATLSLAVTLGIASWWIQADERQDEVVASVPDVPSGTTILLDGVCPFEGAAAVFHTNYDITGRLQVERHDESLVADVVSVDMTYEDGRLVVEYDDDIFAYEPGPDVVLVRPGETPVALTTEASLRGALESSPVRDCPASSRGGGVPLLPLDRRRN